MNHSKQGTLKLSGREGLLIIVVLALAGYALINSGVITTKQAITVTVGGGGIGQQTATQTGTAATGFTAYKVGFTYQEQNSVTGASISTTSPSYRVFHSDGKRLSNLATLYGAQSVSIASGTTETKYPVTQTDGDYLFVYVSPGTAHIPDPSKVLSANPAFIAAKWMPVTTATQPELVAELQISKLGNINLQVDPSVSQSIQVAAFPHDLDVSEDTPPDQTGQGTTAGSDAYITWTLSKLNSGNALAIARLWVTSDQASNLITIEDVKITSSSSIITMNNYQNVGKELTISSAYMTSGTAGGVTQYWRYWPTDEDVSADYSNTLIIPRGTGDADAIYVKVHVKTTFASGNSADVTINVRFISAANALQTAISDTVNIAA